MKRKLVRQGNGALTITLPFSWVKSNNLRKGDYVELTNRGKEILLSFLNYSEERIYNIEITSKKPFFKRYVRTCYVYGYDKVIITSDSTLPLKEINESLNTLIGFEIIEQTNTKAVISTITDEIQKDNIETLMKRLFFMINSLLADISLAIEQRNPDILSNSIYAENSINKLSNFCLRTLNRFGYKDNLKTQNVYFLITSLEEIADELAAFSNTCKSYSPTMSKTVSEMKLYMDEIYMLLFKFDPILLTKTKEKRMNLFAKMPSLNKLHPECIMQLYSALSHMHQIESSLYPL